MKKIWNGNYVKESKGIKKKTWKKLNSAAMLKKIDEQYFKLILMKSWENFENIENMQ